MVRMATVATSVTALTGPLPDADELDTRVEALRLRFPRAIIDRYLRGVPSIGARAMVAPGAAVVGDVRIGADASFWYGAVLRADLAPVIVGLRTNIQDGTVVHVADDTPCEVGDDVVVGHRAMLHACRIEPGCLIGMQATILDEAVIGHGSVVAAGALVTQRTVIPPHSLVMGVPGKVVKKLDEEAEAFHRALAGKYVRVKENYRCDALRKDNRD
jgi:carbonic anhydrase/acetyltransferase-like protein (isoleucine patch superfamily)